MCLWRSPPLRPQLPRLVALPGSHRPQPAPTPHRCPAPLFPTATNGLRRAACPCPAPTGRIPLPSQPLRFQQEQSSHRLRPARNCRQTRSLARGFVGDVVPASPPGPSGCAAPCPSQGTVGVVGEDTRTNRSCLFQSSHLRSQHSPRDVFSFSDIIGQ